VKSKHSNRASVDIWAELAVHYVVTWLVTVNRTEARDQEEHEGFETAVNTAGQIAGQIAGQTSCHRAGPGDRTKVHACLTPAIWRSAGTAFRARLRHAAGIG
jgi:hypothetical protein